MHRSALGFAAAFVAIFAGGYVLIQRGDNRPAPELNLAVNDGRNADPGEGRAEKPSEKKLVADKPTAVKSPLVLKRWPTPEWQKAPDQRGEISVVIDPRGPTVVTYWKSGAEAWDAVSGLALLPSRVEPGTSVRPHRKPDDRWAYQVRDRKTDRILLELPEAPTRDACWAPDGTRLIVVGFPAVYPKYLVLDTAGGSYWHPAEFFKNVRLFDAASGEKIGEFGPKDHGLDDDVWAVAAAADGKSFFLLTKAHLLQVNFAGAFGIPALAPRSR
jgi:hypothetical protein